MSHLRSETKRRHETPYRTLHLNPSIPPIFGWDILLHNAPHFQSFPLLLLRLHLLMFPEMLNVLWMIQILLFHIIATMVLLPMMDFILVLIVSMMPRPHAKVRKFDIFRVLLEVFGEADAAVFVDVEHVEDGLDNHLFFSLGYAGGGGVGETVGSADVDACPEAGAVVIVQVEEGGRVEAGDVVLLCVDD